MPTAETSTPLPSVADEPTSASAPATRSWGTWVSLALFSVLWLDLVHLLSYTWSTDDQYGYGWFVPLLALGLFFKKWPSRPPISEIGSPAKIPRAALAGIVLLAAALFPLRVVHEINADWPLITRFHLLIALVFSLYAIFLVGGWRYVAYFAFPVCFIIIASRWPSRIELPLTQGLMRAAAFLTVELLGWMGIPAIQHGNLIELSTGTVGVDEACSGIRSFQSTVMAGLFLGELYLMRWPLRLLLLAVGLPLAFALNVVRTLFLSSQAASSGLEAVDKWHDSAGMTIFLVTFACLWLLSWLIQSRGQTSSFSSARLSPVVPEVAGVAPPLGLPRGARVFLLAIGCWTIFVLAFTEIWYRRNDHTGDHLRWSVALPENKRGFEPVELPTRATESLQFDIGSTAKWHEDDGAEWNLFFFRWQGLSMQSMMPARFHRPEVCMTGAGWRQTSESGVDYFDIPGLKLPFRKYVFSADGRIVHVFFSLWQDGDELRSGMRWHGRRDRLMMALEGKRRYGLQSLEIITTGYSDLAEAEQAVRQRLPGLIQLGAH